MVLAFGGHAEVPPVAGHPQFLVTISVVALLGEGKVLLGHLGQVSGQFRVILHHQGGLQGGGLFKGLVLADGKRPVDESGFPDIGPELRIQLGEGLRGGEQQGGKEEGGAFLGIQC